MWGVRSELRAVRGEVRGVRCDVRCLKSVIGGPRSEL